MTTLEALAVDLDQFFLIVCGMFVLCKFLFYSLVSYFFKVCL